MQTSKEKKPIVLVLSGVDFIFFMVTGTQLCFGFVLRKELIISRHFVIGEQELHRVKTFFCFLYCPTSEEAGGAQGAGRGHGQDR